MLSGSISISKTSRKNVKVAKPIKREMAVKAKDLSFIDVPPVI